MAKARKYKRLIEKLKVLPFIPMASSISGKTVDRASLILDRGEVNFLMEIEK
jgi:hypothetical protein